jgi:signal peptidase II
VKIESAKIKPFLLTAIVLLLDQISKAIIAINWPVTDGGFLVKKVFGGEFFWIYHVRNKAIAFSLGQNIPDIIKPVLFIVLPLIVLLLLIVYCIKSNEFTKLQQWAIAGIVGGGLGNLIDRIFRPLGVVDFISIKFFGIFGLDRWPTFNIADSSVVVCGILLIISMFLPAKNSIGVAK